MFIIEAIELKADPISTMTLKPATQADLNSWLDSLVKSNVRGVILASNTSPLTKTCHSYLLGKDIFTNAKVKLDQDLSLASITKQLGTKVGFAEFDSSTSSFNANQFAAVVGSLTGGGVLWLNLPADIIDYAERCAKDSNEKSKEQHNDLCPTLLRFIRFMSATQSCVLINEQQLLLPKGQLSPGNQQANDAEADQQALVEKICRVAQGHANRPLVISADRGRGKSSALGIATARLCRIEKPDQNQTILVTAPNKSNLLSFALQFDQALEDLSENKFQTHNTIQLSNGNRLIFMPPDQLLQSKLQPSLLIVDEAAAIPVGLLKKITIKFNRIVFSSTCHGYEGSGKGFDIRFKDQLVKLKPQTRFAQLNKPMRWSLKDNLEPAAFKALLLNTETRALSASFKPESRLDFEILDKSALQKDEARLSQVFSLLVNAHYQTRPADLQQMLTNPAISIATFSQHKDIAAVALLANEGGFSNELCQQISLRQTHLAGELLPQSIIGHCGIISAGELRYLRVMRIAVHPSCRRQLVGSQMIKQILKYAELENFDMVGTSFAATEDVMPFWLKNTFRCIRFGNRKDSASGAHSVEMLVPLNPDAMVIYQQLIGRFTASFCFRVQGELNHLSAEVITLVIAYQLDKVLSNSLTDSELYQFCLGHRSADMVADLLFERFCHFLTAETIGLIDEQAKSLLTDYLIKRRSLNDIANENPILAGKKQAQESLRKYTEKWLLT